MQHTSLKVFDINTRYLLVLEKLPAEIKSYLNKATKNSKRSKKYAKFLNVSPSTLNNQS
jgi:hypothetical protein